MTAEERTLIEKLHYRKGFGVPRILQMPCFSHLTAYSIYKYLNNGHIKLKSKNLYRVQELKRKGYSIPNIVNETGLSRRTVYTYINFEIND
jgi:hypothetical protein